MDAKNPASQTIAMFGEAEKGKFSVPLFFQTLPELAQTLGNPPNESQALHWAVQTLLYHKTLIFIRVAEEGFSKKEYLLGLKSLKKLKNKTSLSALFLPGVGDVEILEATRGLCEAFQSLLITTEKDLYDFLTSI